MSVKYFYILFDSIQKPLYLWSMNGNLLIADDNHAILESLKLISEKEFTTVECLKKPDRLPLICKEKNVDVVLLDMNFSGGHQSGQEGLYWLGRIQEIDPNISVVFITAYAEVDLAVEALKRGASDFVTKPWSNEKLIATLKSAAKLAISKKELQQSKKRETILKKVISKASIEIIGKSAAIQEVNTLISKVAKTDANVLILGENGTGKELVAQQIHQQSTRGNELILGVDLGAIPENLFESELFGHTKGAFTDARESRLGKFEAANRGTLFLDEIANLPLQLQPKLLAALQNREIVKLGSNESISVDIRLISATNQNPEVLVEKGLFREDLLYRLNTIVINVPPLRERGQDIILLAQHFLNHFAEKYKRPVFTISLEATEKLLNYSWPGNVRELQHNMERVVILSESQNLSESNFEFDDIRSRMKIDTKLTLQEMEMKMIQAALDKCKGNMTEAARQLGITRQTLYNKLK